MSSVKLHSSLGPSSAKRWINCPGSVSLIEALRLPPKPSVYSAQGTLAHHLCEQVLIGKMSVGDIVSLSNTGYTKMVDGFEIEVDDEMVDAVDTYVQHIASLRARLPRAKILVEERVFARSIDEHLYGTVDCLFWLPGKELHVIDFKYGKGVPVAAQHNEQLMTYAIAALDSAFNGAAFQTIHLTIVQPRTAGDAVNTWTVTREELHGFASQLADAIKRVRAEKPEFSSGAWCQFCPAKQDCPAMLQKAQAIAKVEFAPVVSGGAPTPPPVATMPPDRLAQVLAWEDTITGWFAAVRARAKDLLENGEEVPGFKLVSGRSNRKWLDEEKVIQDFGSVLGEDEMFEKKILSPAKLEKKLGKGKLAEYTFKPAGAVSVAPDSDPRPAIAVGPQATAEEDFGPSRSKNADGDISELL